MVFIFIFMIFFCMTLANLVKQALSGTFKSSKNLKNLCLFLTLFKIPIHQLSSYRLEKERKQIKTDVYLTVDYIDN